MYSRKSIGYTPCTPPPNYNGVAFTRDFKPYSEISEPPPKEEEEDTKEENVLFEETNLNDSPNDAIDDKTPDPCDKNRPCEEDADRECIDKCDFEQSEHSDSPTSQEPAPEIQPSAPYEEVASKIQSKDMRLEDLLLIGAVILFVSGEFDGDLMLLLGLLLIAGI